MYNTDEGRVPCHLAKCHLDENQISSRPIQILRTKLFYVWTVNTIRTAEMSFWRKSRRLTSHEQIRPVEITSGRNNIYDVDTLEGRANLISRHQK